MAVPVPDRLLHLVHHGKRGLVCIPLPHIPSSYLYLTNVIHSEFECHQLYARYMDGYGVKYDAPVYPFVLPTLFYRKLVRFWWRPLWGSVMWLGNTAYESCWANEEVVKSVTQTATRVVNQYTKTVASQHGTWEADGSIFDDEVI
jgi:hypothetical protein